MPALRAHPDGGPAIFRWWTAKSSRNFKLDDSKTRRLGDSPRITSDEKTRAASVPRAAPPRAYEVRPLEVRDPASEVRPRQRSERARERGPQRPGRGRERLVPRRVA